MKTEIIIGIAFFAAGVFVDHIYYLLSKKDQITLFKKLPEKAKKSIIEDEVSIEDLNNFIHSKVIDKDSLDPLPYKECPKCGNRGLERTEIKGTYMISCKKCHWGEG